MINTCTDTMTPEQQILHRHQHLTDIYRKVCKLQEDIEDICISIKQIRDGEIIKEPGTRSDDMRGAVQQALEAEKIDRRALGVPKL